MKSVPYLFADLTAHLEDLHSVAVEGQSGSAAQQAQHLLAAHLVTGLADARRLARLIRSSTMGTSR